MCICSAVVACEESRIELGFNIHHMLVSTAWARVSELHCAYCCSSAPVLALFRLHASSSVRVRGIVEYRGEEAGCVIGTVGGGREVLYFRRGQRPFAAELGLA